MATLYERLRDWLGEDGKQFFTELKRDHGKLNVVLRIPYGDTSQGPQKYFPHPVHYREGMSVRNWLRQQPECKDWDFLTLENGWMHAVEQALGI